jgi:hypothetical protein
MASAWRAGFGRTGGGARDPSLEDLYWLMAGDQRRQSGKPQVIATSPLERPDPPSQFQRNSDPGPSGDDADVAANLAMSDYRVPRRWAPGSADVWAPLN